MRGAFEVVDFRTGEKSMRDATEWRFTRSQLEGVGGWEEGCATTPF